MQLTTKVLNKSFVQVFAKRCFFAVDKATLFVFLDVFFSLKNYKITCYFKKSAANIFYFG